MVNEALLLGDVDTMCIVVCHIIVSAPPRVCCVVWSLLVHTLHNLQSSSLELAYTGNTDVVVIHLSNFHHSKSSARVSDLGERNGIPYEDFSSIWLLLSTHHRGPYLWGESDHPAFGPPARASLSLNLASFFFTPARSVHKSRDDIVVHMWVQLKRWCVSCVWVLQMGHSGDRCDLALTLCMCDLSLRDLFVLSWARVRRVRRGSISSEMLMCGGGVRSILLLPLVALYAKRQ